MDRILVILNYLYVDRINDFWNYFVLCPNARVLFEVGMAVVHFGNFVHDIFLVFVPSLKILLMNYYNSYIRYLS